MAKRHQRQSDGLYHIKGKTYKLLVGSRAQVYHGTAYKTPGGLVEADILKNKRGRYVSRKKHNTAKKEKRLLKHGWGTEKGKFGAVRLGKKTAKRRRRSSGTRRVTISEKRNIKTGRFSKGGRRKRGGRRRR